MTENIAADNNKNRVSEFERKTGETNISVSVNLDGSGTAKVQTPFGFFNHMLNQLSRHGVLDLSIKATGDVETGSHHLIEDTAIALGRSIDKALGERRGIVRMAEMTCPLDEALSSAAIDLSGRGYAVIDMALKGNAGEFPPDMVRHFFEALAIEGKFCLHIRVLAGTNEHHVIESSFKAFARALKTACSYDIRLGNTIPSTKGTLI